MNTFGLQALARARATVRDSNHANADDRPLYWARLKMQAILKSHEFLVQRVRGARHPRAVARGADARPRPRAQLRRPRPTGACCSSASIRFSCGPDTAEQQLAPQQSGRRVAALFLHGNAAAVAGDVHPERDPAGPLRGLRRRHGRHARGQLPAGRQPGEHDPEPRAATSISASTSMRFATRFRSPSVADNLNVMGQPAVHYELNATQTALETMAGNVEPAAVPRDDAAGVAHGSGIVDGGRAGRDAAGEERRCSTSDSRLAGAADPRGSRRAAIRRSRPSSRRRTPKWNEGRRGQLSGERGVLSHRLAANAAQHDAEDVGHLQVPKLQSDAAGADAVVRRVARAVFPGHDRPGAERRPAGHLIRCHSPRARYGHDLLSRTQLDRRSRRAAGAVELRQGRRRRSPQQAVLQGLSVHAGARGATSRTTA